ncbi:hypothetical protein BKA70DRAFT_1177864 [Coprinopsis sp. MPI-PUGE-AT-0042]|nr:hypothetical protein BKA70DRAFT_1177864 [Coprinopsis sp. MPI-PUGE-AT-0042]
MASRSISALDIQSHLYNCLLQGQTADVHLRVSGRWRAIYRLHRVVLIQSDFFRALFTSDFRESQDSQKRRTSSLDVDVVFDDTNITRAAFEVCLSRLYGGGPSLYLPPCLIPSTAEPLSPSYETGLSLGDVPEGHHPATPRFLLSLLATSIYLSIPTVASQAMSMIFKSIGPYTVIPYLNFALGKSIDVSSTLWADSKAGTGLEGVAQPFDDDTDSGDSPLASPTFVDTKESSTGFEMVSGYSDTSDDGSELGGSTHHYGQISDKIGEACTCWLARWASDMLSFEQTKALSDLPGSFTSLTSSPVIWQRGGLDAERICALISSDSFFVKSERDRYDFAKAVVEMRRKSGVLEGEERKWDMLFEHGIYYINMPVEDIIAISKEISPTTKKPYVPMSVLQTTLWSQSLLRHQITYKPPGSPGQASSPPPRDKELGIGTATRDLQDDGTHKYYYPVLGDSSLRLGDNGNDLQPSEGTSLSMEDLFNFSHSPVVSLARQSANQSGSGNKVAVDTEARISSSEETLFGLRSERYTVEQCIAADPSGKRRWSPFPPHRFGVEFWDIDSLKEKSRLHSHTFWYAGSLFNIYIQIVKKKGQAQLGIYLHRQSTIEPVPSPSAPCPSFTRSPGLETDRTQYESISAAASRPRGHSVIGPMLSSMNQPSPLPTLHSSRSFNGLGRVQTVPTPPSSPLMSTPGSSVTTSTSSTSLSVPFTTSGVAPVQPYRDPRSSISAYFSIACASATGSSQMKFTSAPDVFSVSQSWGWKTSALRTEEYMELKSEEGSDSSGRVTNPLKSLRATVIVGLI